MRSSFKNSFFVLVLLVVVFSKSHAQFYYGMQMDFGKNRIQYQNFKWTYLDYDRYRVYTYQGGLEIAKYVSVQVNKQLPILEKRLDYQLEDKIQIVVYNTQSDFKQSNIGLANDALNANNVGGVTKIIGDKVFVYFNGSHADLDRQIRAALAELIINQTLYGGRARDMVRNSALLNVPEWYTQGLIQYLSQGWTTYADNLMYDALKNDRFNNFNRLSGKEASNAGHALWYYVVDTYGDAVIPNLLTTTRSMRSPDNAFMYVLGTSLQNLIADFTEAQNRRLYMFKDSLRVSPVKENEVVKKPKSDVHYYNLKLSPDAQNVIYATSYLSQIKVFVQDVNSGKKKRLLKMGPKLERLEDFNYPLLAWHPANTLIAMLYEKEGAIVLHTYDVESHDKVKRPITGFKKINSISFSHDGKKLVMSAVKQGKGQADIFVFTLNNGGVEQLTNDTWDDLNPVFIKNSKNIVFESNRLNDTIKSNEDANPFARMSRNMDLFMASYPFGKEKALVRVTNTPDINETLPQSYSNLKIAYLSEKSGIYNRYVAEFDSSISYVDTTEHYRYFFNSKPITNYDRNILEQHVNHTRTHVAEVVFANGRERLLIQPLVKNTDELKVQPRETWFKAGIRPSITNPEKITEVLSLEPDALPEKEVRPGNNTAPKGIDFDNYKFDTENKTQQAKDSSVTLTKPGDSTLKPKPLKTPEFRFPIQQNYYTSFYNDNVITQFDNSYLNATYQYFTGFGGPIYLNPGLNFLTKVSLSDLFEDQNIIAAFRFGGMGQLFATSSFDNEQLLSWEFRKKRFDHRFTIHRQVILDNVFKLTTRDGKYEIKYPFNEVSAVKASVLLRNDKLVVFSQGDASLPFKDLYSTMGALHGEYVFDNTRKVMLNIYNGWRLKVWGQYWQMPDSLNRQLIVGGFDIRHYQKVHRQMTWCNRLAGGTSWGSDRLIYYMGGVDNWFGASFDRTINIVKPEQYTFQTLATNMRGFRQNVRNGNNFVVFNSELRWPIVRYFANHALRSDFLNNLQVIGFADLGMAWYGLNPLSEENTLNKNSYSNGPVTVIVYNEKSPLVGGVGFGFRSRILGYFMRFDVSWGIEDLKTQKSINYFSLTTDF